MQNIEKITYKQAATSNEIWQNIKAVSFPVIILLYSLVTISTFAQFGTKIIAMFIAIMWGVATVEAIIFGAQRKTILNEALAFIGIYNSTLLVLRFAIRITSNATTEQLVASYNQVITLSQSSAIPGYLQNALWMSSVFVPIGYLGMQAKRLFQYKKSIRKDKAMQQYRSIRR